jgi:hypothetical protein
MYPSGKGGLGLPPGCAGGPCPGSVPDNDTPGGDAAGLPKRVAHERPQVTADLRLAAVGGVEHDTVDAVVGQR